MDVMYVPYKETAIGVTYLCLQVDHPPNESTKVAKNLSKLRGRD